MKELTQKEFEEQIERVIDGKIGRKALAKELETDIRTLNRKITELADTNPDLYFKFIEKFPYKPKEIKLNLEELALYAIQKGTRQAAIKFGISRRTVTRKVNKLKKEQPELYGLFCGKEYIQGEHVPKIKKDEYVYNVSKHEDIKRKGNISVAAKRKELEETISEFEKLLATGMSKAKAARTMGYDDYPTIWKKYQELQRIVTEETIRKNKEEQKSFRNSLKAETPRIKKVTQVQRNVEGKDIEIDK